MGTDRQTSDDPVDAGRRTIDGLVDLADSGVAIDYADLQQVGVVDYLLRGDDAVQDVIDQARVVQAALWAAAEGTPRSANGLRILDDADKAYIVRLQLRLAGMVGTGLKARTLGAQLAHRDILDVERLIKVLRIGEGSTGSLSEEPWPGRWGGVDQLILDLEEAVSVARLTDPEATRPDWVSEASYTVRPTGF